jgi:thimet oligopeptidase
MPRRIVVAAAVLLSAPLHAQVAVSHAPPLASAWHLTGAELAAHCRDAVRAAHDRIESLLAAPAASRTFARTLRPVEDAEGALWNASSPWQVMLNVSTDAAVRDSSAACGQMVANFFTETNADPRLYDAAVRASRERLSNAVDRRLAALYVEAGRHAGGSLDTARRARVTALLKRLNDVQRDFAVRLNADSTRVPLTAAEAEPVRAALGGRLRAEDEGVSIPADESTVGPFLRLQPSPAARRRFVVAYGRRGGQENVRRLEQAVAIRDTLAHLFGFPTWAAYQLDVKMAKTPARAIALLRQVDDGLLPKARQELAAIDTVARADGFSGPIGSSDYNYYSERLRQTRYAVNTDSIRQYFPVDHVLPEVLGIYQSLLGVRFAEVKQADVWAPGVQEYTVADAASGRPLGRFYLDLYPRPNKYGHFMNTGFVITRRLPDGTRELPIGVMVGNWTAPEPGKPSLLTHGEVVTFFHEFGHAMALMCDQSPYVSTGTAALRQDFVEALSQMLENWMWEPAALRRVSRHVVTGRPLPDSLIDRMIALKRTTQGYGGTHQGFFGLYDLTLHTAGPSVDAMALWTRLASELTTLPSEPGTYPVASFGHFMSGYDAGYYGYLWSRVYAQDMFTRFAREGVMNPSVGRAYRDMILAPGATEEPDVLLRRFLGRPLRYDAFFEEMGVPRPTTKASR